MRRGTFAISPSPLMTRSFRHPAGIMSAVDPPEAPPSKRKADALKVSVHSHFASPAFHPRQLIRPPSPPANKNSEDVDDEDEYYDEETQRKV